MWIFKRRERERSTDQWHFSLQPAPLFHCHSAECMAWRRHAKWIHCTLTERLQKVCERLPLWFLHHWKGTASSLGRAHIWYTASMWRGKMTCKLETWGITQEPMDKAIKQQEQLHWLKACSVGVTTSKTLEGFGRLAPCNQQITAIALLPLLRRNASNRLHSLQSSPVQRSLHNSTVWLFEHGGALFSVAWDFSGNPLAWAKFCKCQTLVHPALRPPD